MIRFFLGAVLTLLLVPSAGTAEDYAAGWAAFATGDVATAVRKWTPVAVQGDARAQIGLGWIYDQGRGVPQDYTEAAKWYRMAAEQGDAVGQLSLGNKYEEGKGVLQDYAEAVKWYQLAAEQGDAFAHYSLGLMYKNGQGVPQDYIAAYMWLNISAAKADATSDDGKAAIDARDSIGEKLNPADLSEAQRRARVCLASTYQDCD